MKKRIAIVLVIVMALTAMLPAAAAEGAYTFSSEAFVTKWKNKTEKVGDVKPNLTAADFFAAGEGQDGRGALKLDTDAMGCPDRPSTIVELTLADCVDIAKGQTVIVKITAKGNKATGTSGSRIALRIAVDDGDAVKPDTRCYVVQPGDGSYATHETEVTATDHCTDLNLVTLTVTAGTVVYIDKIEVVDKATGASMFNSSILEAPQDGEEQNPGTADPIMIAAIITAGVIPAAVAVNRKKSRR